MQKNIEYLNTEITMPLMSLPVRSVIVRLSKANVFISPGSQLSTTQLKSAAPITDLVAPNFLHTKGIPVALKEFPQAKVWGPVGANEKKSDIPWNAELNLQTWPYQDELVLIPIQGLPATQECIFFHKASKTLILCDLTFNLTHPKGLGAWLVLHTAGSYKKFAMSRFVKALVKDKKAFLNSLQEIFKYDFETISVSHGDLIQNNAKEKLRQAFRERGIETK